jgi:superfamily II DNA or RNA helicase
MLDADRRVAVAGPAGAGKTLTAAEKAPRLAAQGFDVLFTCFNRPLADHLRRTLADEPRIRNCWFHRRRISRYCDERPGSVTRRRG